MSQKILYLVSEDWYFVSHRLPMARYLHRHYLGERVGTHHSSFGCPFGCNFCAVVEMSNRRWVAQSPARIAAVLDTQQRAWGIDAVQFHDMDFFISEPRVAEFAGRIADRGLKDEVTFEQGQLRVLQDFKLGPLAGGVKHEFLRLARYLEQGHGGGRFGKQFPQGNRRAEGGHQAHA